MTSDLRQVTNASVLDSRRSAVTPLLTSAAARAYVWRSRMSPSSPVQLSEMLVHVFVGP